jgi:putative flippase GtrA
VLDYRLFRFLVVGFANTLVGLLVIFACKWLLGMGDISSNAAGYGVGILIGFLLNRQWTFEHKGKLAPAFLRYLAVLASAYLINLTLVLYAINGLHLNTYLAQALGVVPYTVINYLGSRFFAFQKTYHEAS